MSDVEAIDAVLSLSPVIPVYSPGPDDDAVEVARALLNGGIGVIEVTLRGDHALIALNNIAAQVPGMVVGAGTVLDPTQAAIAIDAGARFLVSPGLTAQLVAAKPAVPLLPGVATASELMVGLQAGWRRFKLFPASAIGGVNLLRAFAGPFPNARFCPTGGIGADTAPDYLSLSNVACIGGSWLTPAAAIRAADWRRIESLARDAVRLRG